MMDQLRRILDLAARGDVKKSDLLATRLLRSELTDEDRGKVLRCRARVRLLAARPDDALEDLVLANQFDPQNAQQPETMELIGDAYFARFELARVGFSDRNDIQEARRILSNALLDYPKYDNVGWVYYQLGRIYLSVGDVTEAEVYFRRALDSSSQLNYLVAYCFERLGFIAYYDQRDLERSLNFLDRAIEEYPPGQPKGWIVQVYILRSRVLKGMRRYQDACKSAALALDEAIALRPENKLFVAETLFAVGETTSEIEGSEQETISYLSQFIQINKKPQGVDVTWSRAYEMLGNAHFDVGRYEDAISAFRMALQYNPDHPWGTSLYYRIACGYYHEHEYDNVVATIEHMLRVADQDNQTVDDYRIYDLLGNALFAQNQYINAAEAYEKALKLLPPNGDNNSYKIKSYYDLALNLS